jgi:hypothetical protein
MSDLDDLPERRQTDKRLVAALEEMRELKVGIADFAEIVKDPGCRSRSWCVRQVGVLLAVLLVILMAFSLWQVSKLNARLDGGQDKITCLLLIEPADRTAQSLIDCQRGHL